MMKFTVKDCAPTTGEADEEGYEDEYVVSGRRGPWGSRPVCTCVPAGFHLGIAQEFLFLT